MQFENPVGPQTNMQQAPPNSDPQGNYNQFQHQHTPFYIDNILGPSPPGSTAIGNSSNGGNLSAVQPEDDSSAVNNASLAHTPNPENAMTPGASSMSPAMPMTIGPTSSYPLEELSCPPPLTHNARATVTSAPAFSPAMRGLSHQTPPGLVVPTPIQAVPGHPPPMLGYPPASPNSYSRPAAMYEPPRIPNGYNPSNIPYHPHAGSYGPGPGLYSYPHPDYAAQAWLLERHAYTKRKSLALILLLFNSVYTCDIQYFVTCSCVNSIRFSSSLK